MGPRVKVGAPIVLRQEIGGVMREFRGETTMIGSRDKDGNRQIGATVSPIRDEIGWVYPDLSRPFEVQLDDGLGEWETAWG